MKFEYITEKPYDRRRLRRALNICVWFVKNYEKYSATHEEIGLCSKQIRALIRQDMKIQVKDIAGDNKGNGDAFHSLGLKHIKDRDKKGLKKLVLFTDENLTICKDYYEAYAKDFNAKEDEIRSVKAIGANAAHGRDLTPTELKRASPRHILYYFVKESVYDGLGPNYAEKLTNEIRGKTAAQAATLCTKKMQQIPIDIKNREKPGVSELFKRFDAARDFGLTGNYEEAFFAIFPDLVEKHKVNKDNDNILE